MALTQKTKRTLFWLQLIASISGVGLSLYLFIHHIRLKAGLLESASFCSLGKWADCDVVASSKYSELFGIPNSALGAIFFFVAFVLCLFNAPKEKSFFKTRLAMWVWCLIGALMDLYFFSVQLFLIKSFCIVCLATYVCLIVVLVCSYFLIKDKPTTDSLPKDTMIILSAVSVLAFGILIALIPSWVRADNASYKRVQEAMDSFYSQWKDKPSKVIEHKDADAVAGNPNAKIKIVEFSDFQCPFCKRAAFTMHSLLPTMKDKVFFVFKHFPLDSSCNSGLETQIHPQACRLARLAYCANKKGKFWEYHDLVFFKLDEDTIKEGLESYKPKLSSIFTPAEVDECLASPASLESTQQDVKMGNEMKVRATPTVYINGKHVTIPITVETMHKLIQIEEGLVK